MPLAGLTCFGNILHLNPSHFCEYVRTWICGVLHLFAGLDQVQNSSLPAHIHSLSASQQKVTLILILGSVGDLRSLKILAPGDAYR